MFHFSSSFLINQKEWSPYSQNVREDPFNLRGRGGYGFFRSQNILFRFAAQQNICSAHFRIKFADRNPPPPKKKPISPTTFKLNGCSLTQTVLNSVCLRIGFNCPNLTPCKIL